MLAEVLWQTGRRVFCHRVTILMYHGITAKPIPFYNWCQVSVEEFEQQIEFVSKHYRVVPLSEVVVRLQKGLPIPPHTLCLTFDDGFRSVLTTALPVLTKHRLPATVFVVTGLMDTGEPPWPERLYLAVSSTDIPALDVDGRRFGLGTSEERTKAFEAILRNAKELPARKKEHWVGELIDNLGVTQVDLETSSIFATLKWEEVDVLRRSGLVEIGLHTHTHQILSRCSMEEQRSELGISAALARERWGEIDLFAYPNGQAGDFTDDTKELLRDLGFRCGLTTIDGLNRRRPDLFELHRVGIGRGASPWSTKKALSGF